jgi:hypothetical protein
VRVLKAGALYFAIVFGAGFAMGPVRLLWLVPRFGVRRAELMEMPVMLLVMLAAAPWIVRRFAVPSTVASRLAMGAVALGLLLAAEFTLVLWLRHLAIPANGNSRDPVSGTVYYLMLALFAVLPLRGLRAGKH